MKNTIARAIAASCLVTGMSGTWAQTTSLVNFDPPGTPQGPSIFVAVPAQQTIDTAPATFSGGVVLGLATFFPAILFASSPNVYGTADFGHGLSKLLTIDTKALTTEVSFALFNGETFNQAYVINSYARDLSLLSTFTTAPIVPNFSSGYTLIDIKNTADIGRVTIEAQNQPAVWDFLIDSVGFNQNVATQFPSLPPPPVYVPNLPAPITVDPIIVTTVDIDVVDTDGHKHKQKGKTIKGFINYGDDIDNARSNVVEFISPVPEASTWAMMLAGLALMGTRVRRARRQQGSGFTGRAV